MAARPIIKPIDKIISKDDRIEVYGRSHICKSGINKIAAYYRLDSITGKPQVDQVGVETLITIRVLVSDLDGRITTRTASAATSENKDLHSLAAIAETRAYGRAVLAAVGSGEVTAEEMSGTAPRQPVMISREQCKKMLEAADKAA